MPEVPSLTQEVEDRVSENLRNFDKPFKDFKDENVRILGLTEINIQMMIFDRLGEIGNILQKIERQGVRR